MSGPGPESPDTPVDIFVICQIVTISQIHKWDSMLECNSFQGMRLFKKSKKEVRKQTGQQ